MTPDALTDAEEASPNRSSFWESILLFLPVPRGSTFESAPGSSFITEYNPLTQK